MEHQDKNPPKTLLEALQARVEQTPGKMAFRFLHTGEVDGAYTEVTYLELDQKARTIAADLQSQGFNDGTALLLEKSNMLTFTPEMLVDIINL